MFEWLPTVRMKKIKRAENIMEMGNGRGESERERERERVSGREGKNRKIMKLAGANTEGTESISVVMTVETIKDHREMSTKLSFLFISLFFIHYAQ